MQNTRKKTSEEALQRSRQVICIIRFPPNYQDHSHFAFTFLNHTIVILQVIKDFLNKLNETERNHHQKNMILFASRQMMESLRVTLLSMLDIIEELLAAGGTLYVLTAKLNQDPLEVISAT